MRPASGLLSIILIAGFVLSGCSVYRNKGRDQFEKRSAGNVKSEIGISGGSADESELLVDEDFSSCWIQGRDEALWSAPEGSSLRIRSLNDKNMAVCLETKHQETDNNDKHH